MFMFEASHALLFASVPVATAAGIIATVTHRHAPDFRKLDTELQDRLCKLVDSPGWARMTDEEAWAAIKSLGGRRHLLGQARLMLSLTIEKAKDGHPDALVMEANLRQLAELLKIGWKRLLMPQTHARLCVEIFADMCTVWEDQDLDNQWLPMI